MNRVATITGGLLIAATVAAFGQPAPNGNSLSADGPDSAAPPGAAGTPSNWIETRLAIEERSDAGDFEAALALGDSLLEQVAEEFGEASANLAEAHRLLASVHRRDQDYPAAEDELLLAIEVYERVGGPVTEELIGPFLDLGDVYSDSGDYSAAMSAYGEARTISRRNSGLLNSEQLPMLDLMTDAAVRLGDIEEARNLQLDALTLIERVAAPADAEVIEAQYKYAAWLREQRFYEEERRIYYQIQRVIRDEYDDDPLMLTRSFRERAASYRHENNGEQPGSGGLEEALELLEAMDDPPILLMAQVLVELGDWGVEFRPGRTVAANEYLRAWRLLGELENGDELRAEWFDGLHEIELPQMSQRGLSTNPADPRGHVVVYFTVDMTGEPTNIRITESVPPGFKDGAAIRVIRLARFRPKVVNGEFVTEQRAYRFEFNYLPQAAADGEG